MPGKILIIDSVATNRIVLKVRLTSAFYDVALAASSKEARAMIKQDLPDLILVNSNLEDRPATDFCAELRNAKATAHIPMVMICNFEDREQRLHALKAGVSDILVRPLDDSVLQARLRSLLRSHETAEESKIRNETNHALGFAESAPDFVQRARVQIATPDAATAVRWAAVLKPMMPYELTPKVYAETLKDIAEAKTPDVFVIAMDHQKPEGALRLVAEIRARATTRHAGILMIMSDERRRTLVDALDLGAHDVMVNGFDPDELALRVSRLVSQKRLSDRQRDNVNISLQAAVTDPLTGLFNRRYAMPQLRRMQAHALAKKRSFAVILADLDHFKQVNDRFGHAAGDAVLSEVAQRLRDGVRSVDLVARIGGEEFLIVLPDADETNARETADRLCDKIKATPICIPELEGGLTVTMSLGVAICGHPNVSKPIDTLISQADAALYDAKSSGRDQVRLAKVPA
ncbi:diguanylate cyclase [Cognatishimia maritima]|uniref:diguanylate cyclase n=1 Tax=Cognatishimia maritima TaxID=870908 RepID=A0A1M5UCM4_9RHOB|nr:diguanylate cyclase [Cognatishimia maritima]SHH60658.1 two-component system, cell cycle response regulator [Cognatishimia maritima]